KWKRLLNLNPHHFRKLSRIDSWQSKSLREDSGHRQAQNNVVLGRDQRHDLLERAQKAHVPRAVAIAHPQKIPTVRGRRDEHRFRDGGDHQYSCQVSSCGIRPTRRNTICTVRVALPALPTLTTRYTGLFG